MATAAVRFGSTTAGVGPTGADTMGADATGAGIARAGAAWAGAGEGTEDVVGVGEGAGVADG